MLDLSQIESGQFTLSRSWGDIGEIVREATQAVEPLFLAKGLTLTSVQSVPAPPLFFDRLRIRQIVLNLLSNSGRFTTTGGATLAISFDHRELVVAVSDTGPGIRPEDQGKVFEPFQQLESSTRRTHDGSGLGLSISQRLVELHGGRMWLQSEVGVGSTFLFSLPLRADQSVRSDVSRWFNPYTSYIERPRRVIDLPKPKPQILLLERGNVLHHQLNHYLGEIEVIAVQTIAELNLALSSAIPNTILINDPQVMADWGLLRRTVDLPARTPVISCYVPSAQEAYEQLNVVNYLVKPVLRDQLLAAIAQIAPTKSTILVVEDSPEMAHLIVRQLTSAGQDYRVLRASDGQRALAFMRERQPDAVLLDLGLPDLDGYQVLQEKNADHRIRSIPVIIVSARDPFGDPVVTNRLRIELAGGLSVRDILLSTTAIGRALSPLKRKLGAE
ncbi:MAG TPA: ATP-binding protein [Caldilineaceae bacterium]|nr:ATP-binding protein [Caldilineaceae bacterium]